MKKTTKTKRRPQEAASPAATPNPAARELNEADTYEALDALFRLVQRSGQEPSVDHARIFSVLVFALVAGRGARGLA